MVVNKVAKAVTGLNNPVLANTVKTDKNFKRNYHAAMSYVHYEISAIQLKKEVIKYLKSIHPEHKLLAKMKDMNENRFLTVGKYMYLLNHGCDLPDDVAPKVMPALEKVIYEEEERLLAIEERNKHSVKIEKPIISIQDRIRERASEVIGEIDGWTDDFLINRTIPIKTVEQFVNLFNTYSIKSQHVKFIQGAFSRRIKEIEDVLLGKDSALAEGYAHYSKSELKKCDQFNKNLMKACDMLQDVAKVERLPRKKKLISVDKTVSKLKYKKDDKALGLVSINPTQLIGAKEVWTYSVKTRKLSHYKSSDIDGITVKGASLINFSEDSIEKTLRKPEEALADFKKASKVKLRTFLKELTTIDTPCTGKLNDSHIILRVDK